MLHTLITFLGKVRKSEGSKYRTTVYDFESAEFGACAGKRESAFFGLILAEVIKPDKLVVLGTSGSMWDVFIDALDLSGVDDELLNLCEDVDANKVTQRSLDLLSPLVSDKLKCDVSLRIIPYGRDSKEQLEILSLMAEQFCAKHEATLDITHGLRHLPMLAALSALYLESALNVKIRGIYYGAFEMSSDGIVPVINLAGLLQIASWVGALKTFDKDGDYSVFAPLLEEDGVDTKVTEKLERAAFFERTSNCQKAQRELSSFRSSVFDKFPNGLPGVGQLFTKQLDKRTKWAEQTDLYEQQKKLAWQYWNQRDYIRSSLYALEAFVTSLIKHDGVEDEDNFKDRKMAKEEFSRGRRGSGSTEAGQAFRCLDQLRNALAHGTEPEKTHIAKILASDKSLHDKLEESMRTLLNPKLK